jgi:hypothetical protein
VISPSLAGHKNFNYSGAPALQGTAFYGEDESTKAIFTFWQLLSINQVKACDYGPNRISS